MKCFQANSLPRCDVFISTINHLCLYRKSSATWIPLRPHTLTSRNPNHYPFHTPTVLFPGIKQHTLHNNYSIFTCIHDSLDDFHALALCSELAHIFTISHSPFAIRHPPSAIRHSQITRQNTTSLCNLRRFNFKIKFRFTKCDFVP